MPHTKIGYDCAAVVGVEMMDEARADFVNNGQAVIEVIEGGAEAIKCRNMKSDGVVIHRLIGSGDANWEHIHNWGGPQKYLDACMKVCNNNHVVMQFMNESGIHHADDKPGQTPLNIQCAMQGLEYAHLRNQPIAINMTGLGGPDDGDIPLMVPLLRRMNEINTERGLTFAYLMLHEYYPQHDPQFVGMRWDIRLQKMRWMNLNPMSTQQEDGSFADPDNILNYGNWFCGRYARLIYILDRDWGISCPPIIIGEFGADDLISEYHGPWNPGYPGYALSEEEYAAHLIWLADNVYDPHDPESPYYEYAKNVVGMCTFMYGNSGGWEGFDFSRKRVFRGLLAEYALKNEKVKNMKIYKNIQEFNINIRYSPNKGAAVVGSIVPGQEVEMDENSQVIAEGYYWLQTVDGKWAAWKTETGVVWLEVQGTVDPEPEPEPGPTPSKYVTKTELNEYLSAVLDAIDALNAPDWRKIAEAARLTRIAHEQAAEAWGIIETELTPEETT